MQSFIIWLLIVVIAVPAAVSVLIGVEVGSLVLWKLRRCPNCRRRYAFPGWNWAAWQMHHRFYGDWAGDRRFGCGVICPHCSYKRWTGEAGGFANS